MVFVVRGMLHACVLKRADPWVTTACRERVRARIASLYVDSTLATHVQKLKFISAKLRVEYPTMPNPHTMARRWASRMLGAYNRGRAPNPAAQADALRDKARSGRPKVSDRVPYEELVACAKELGEGEEFQGERRPYETGDRMRACKAADRIMRTYSISPKKLLEVLQLIDTGLEVCRGMVVRALTATNKQARMEVAQQRRASLLADPRWHARVLMGDSSHKFLGQLLGQKFNVVVHKNRKGELQQRLTDERITWRKVKFSWFSFLSADAGVGPLVWLPGTAYDKEEVNPHVSHRPCMHTYPCYSLPLDIKACSMCMASTHEHCNECS